MNQQLELSASDWALVSIREDLGVAAAERSVPQRCEQQPGTGDERRTTDSSAPIWLLRRLLAEALQCGEMSLAEGVACMQALEAG